MKAAIVQTSELIVAALIFGVVIGLVAPLNALDAQSGGAMEASQCRLSACHMFPTLSVPQPVFRQGLRRDLM